MVASPPGSTPGRSPGSSSVGETLTRGGIVEVIEGANKFRPGSAPGRSPGIPSVGETLTRGEIVAEAGGTGCGSGIPISESVIIYRIRKKTCFILTITSFFVSFLMNSLPSSPLGKRWNSL